MASFMVFFPRLLSVFCSGTQLVCFLMNNLCYAFTRTHTDDPWTGKHGSSGFKLVYKLVFDWVGGL